MTSLSYAGERRRARRRVLTWVGVALIVGGVLEAGLGPLLAHFEETRQRRQLVGGSTAFVHGYTVVTDISIAVTVTALVVSGVVLIVLQRRAAAAER